MSADDEWDDDAPSTPMASMSMEDNSGGYKDDNDNRGRGGYGGGRGGGRGGGGGYNRDNDGGGGRQSRPGDWDCSCGQNNFASRQECYKCHEAKPEGAGGNDGGGGGRQSRPGDWDCSCGQSNFASRQECYKCHEAKPEGAGGNDGGGGGGGRQSRPGDWNCSCGQSNFASRQECYKCHEAKPEGAGGYEGGGGGGRQSRPGDWNCSCGQSNFANRQECFKCQEAKPEGAGNAEGNSGPRSRPGDWKCECGQSNFASRTECYKCQLEKPEGASECNGNVGENGEERPPIYVPPTELEGDEAFSNRKQYYEGSGINFSKYDDIKFEITSTGEYAQSIKSFSDMKLRDLIAENLGKVGYLTPTPIQRHATPQLMCGLDVMACAQTGSGKTCAFLLPIIHVLMSNQDHLDTGTQPVKPEALILAPTRELAIQINREARLYSQNSILRAIVCYGGAAIFAQRSQLQMGCNILTATPGRLKQFINDGIVSLEKLQFFVLDEADRMLDMGFMGDVQEIVGKMPSTAERTSGMFSATFPIGVQKAAAAFLKTDYVFVVIGVVGGACTDVEQVFIKLERDEKRDKLIEILQEIPDDAKVLVFCNAKKGADFLAMNLLKKNVSTTSIHGDRMQSQRELALREFTQGKRKVLVATAVAARGLDIPKVSVVVNYDLPNEIEEYVHRIGRTGRLGHTGKAISFYDEGNDSALVGPLIAILEGAGQAVPDFLKGDSGGYDGVTNGFSSTDHRGGAGPASNKNDDDEGWDD